MLIVLISCVSKKLKVPTQAKDMYISPLFKGAYKYAKILNADKIFILSAKYGLLDETTVIHPYNETLNTKSEKEIKEWAMGVYRSLCKVSDIDLDKYVFLAGEKYRKYLVSYLHKIEIPLQGLSIGKQLAFYKENT